MLSGGEPTTIIRLGFGAKAVCVGLSQNPAKEPAREETTKARQGIPHRVHDSSAAAVLAAVTAAAAAAFAVFVFDSASNHYLLADSRTRTAPRGTPGHESDVWTASEDAERRVRR